MSKVVLVIDIPDDFLEYYRNFYEQFYVECDLRAKHKYEMEDHSLGLIQKCPLKPMPKSINEEKALNITKVKDHTYLNGVVDGFSICLDEILGDEK